MRPVVVAVLIVVAGCGGSSSDSDVDDPADATTTVAEQAGDDELFTESDDASTSAGGEVDLSSSGGGAEARDGEAEPDEPGGDGDTDTDVEREPAGDDGGAGDEGGAGRNDGADDTTTGAAATNAGSEQSSAGADGEAGSDGGSDGGDDRSAAGGGDTTGGDGGGSDDASIGDGGADDGGLRAEDIDRAVLLDSAELGALGLGSGWDTEIVIEPASGDDEAPCGLGRILEFDQLYADSTDAEGSEFEQVVVPGASSIGVEVVSTLPTCDEVVGELGGDGRTIELSVAGATSALGFAVSDDIGDEVLTWFAADVDGTAILTFHVGAPGNDAAVRAAFEQLVADVAVGI